MAAPTLLQTLRAEVARMQSLHPEREGELARANALIVNGMVTASPGDPETGQVLSSDLMKTYNVNGSCSCQAGQHGKDCKHQHAWKLYQFIAKKVAGHTTPEVIRVDRITPLPEARASLNFRAMVGNFEVQVTLRDETEAAILDRLQALLKRQDIRPMPKPAPRTGSWKRGNQGR